jgi:hypothetical protein
MSPVPSALLATARLTAGFLAFVTLLGLIWFLAHATLQSVGYSILVSASLFLFALFPRRELNRVWWIFLLLASVSLILTASMVWADYQLVTGPDWGALAGRLLVSAILGVMIVEAIACKERKQ